MKIKNLLRNIENIQSKIYTLAYDFETKAEKTNSEKKKLIYLEAAELLNRAGLDLQEAAGRIKDILDYLSV